MTTINHPQWAPDQKFRCPLKNIPFRLAQSILPELLGLQKFNDKTSSSILKTIGGMHDQMLGYMKSFIAKDEYLLMDLTHVFSKSSLITISLKGYNNQMNLDPQFNLLYLYSSKSRMPVFTRFCPGIFMRSKHLKTACLKLI